MKIFFPRSMNSFILIGLEMIREAEGDGSRALKNWLVNDDGQ